jgi:hypothetical protein
VLRVVDGRRVRNLNRVPRWLCTLGAFNKLEGRLGERNSAAHPSGVKTTPKAAEVYIEDLVENLLSGNFMLDALFGRSAPLPEPLHGNVAQLVVATPWNLGTVLLYPFNLRHNFLERTLPVRFTIAVEREADTIVINVVDYSQTLLYDAGCSRSVNNNNVSRTQGASSFII